MRSSDSLTILGRLDSLKAHSFLLRDILLAGHTDNRGGDAYNDSLSLRRAETVRNFLAGQGVADSVFRFIQGYGKRRPLNANTDAEEQALNRRVEIVFEGMREPEQTEPAGVIGLKKQTVPTLTLQEALKDTTTTFRQNIVLRDVNFYGGRHVPLPISYLELDELVKAMKAHPGMKIEIQGHVCCVPDDLDGQDFDTRSTDLSLERALFVYKYLVLKGIKANRMTYKGYGASRKLYPEERTPLEQALNRRVEIKVLNW